MLQRAQAALAVQQPQPVPHRRQQPCILPQLPERLHLLQKLAYNLWWCWNTDAVDLFRRIDVERFESVDHSPVKLLGVTPKHRFEELAKDDGFLAHLYRVDAALDDYLSRSTWFQDTYGHDSNLKIAYFSAEFGLHEGSETPLYSLPNDTDQWEGW